MTALPPDGDAAAFSQRVSKVLESLVYASSSEGAAPADALGVLLPDPNPEAAQGVTAASPSDRAAYLRRLRTFRPGLWAGRPGCVGAVAAARRGWCCVRTEADVLACETCSARLAFPIPPSWTPQQTQQAAFTVAPKLASAHKAGCAWRSGLTAALCVSFPESFTRNELRDAFESRRAALLCLPRLPAPAPPPSQEGASGLATLSAQRQGAAGTAQAHAAQAAAAAPVPPPVAQAELRAEADACWLAVCGWRCDARAAGAQPARPDHSTRALRCDACGACVGLWNLAPGRPPPGSPAYAHAAASARLASLSSPSRAASSSSELVNVTALAYAAQPRTTMLRTIAGGAPASAMLAQGGNPSGPFGAKRRRTDDGAGVCDGDGEVFAALSPQEGLSQAGLPNFDALAAHRPACPWACAWPAEAEPDAPPPPKGCAAGWTRTLRALLPEDAGASETAPADAHTQPTSQGVHAPPRTRTAADAREVVRQLLAGKT